MYIKREKMENNGYYTTDTLALASWLKSQNYELAAYEKVQVFNGNGMRTVCQFHFKDSNGAIKEAVAAFDAGCAIGNVNQYEYARRDLMRIVKLP